MNRQPWVQRYWLPLCCAYLAVVSGLVIANRIKLEVAVMIVAGGILRGRLWVQFAVFALLMFVLVLLRQTTWGVAVAFCLIFILFRILAQFIEKKDPLR